MRIHSRQSTLPSLCLLNNLKRQSIHKSNKRNKKAARLNNHTVKADAGLWETGAAKQNTGFPGTPIHYLKKEKKLIKHLFN